MTNLYHQKTRMTLEGWNDGPREKSWPTPTRYNPAGSSSSHDGYQNTIKAPPEIVDNLASWGSLRRPDRPRSPTDNHQLG